MEAQCSCRILAACLALWLNQSKHSSIFLPLLIHYLAPSCQALKSEKLKCYVLRVVYWGVCLKIHGEFQNVKFQLW